jgi:hypothetical protein
MAFPRAALVPHAERSKFYATAPPESLLYIFQYVAYDVFAVARAPTLAGRRL